MKNFENNINSSEGLLAVINSDLEYQFNPEDEGFNVLTKIRYADIDKLNNAYFCDLKCEKNI